MRWSETATDRCLLGTSRQSRMATASLSPTLSCSLDRALNEVFEWPQKGRQRVCGETKTVRVVVDHVRHLRLMRRDRGTLLIEHIPDGEPHPCRRSRGNPVGSWQMPTPYRVRPQLQCRILTTKLACETGSSFVVAMRVVPPGDEQTSRAHGGDYVASHLDRSVKIGAFHRRCCIRQTKFEECSWRKPQNPAGFEEFRAARGDQPVARIGQRVGM